MSRQSHGSDTSIFACPRASVFTPFTANGRASDTMRKMGARWFFRYRSSITNFAVPKSTSVLTTATAAPPPM